MEILPNETQLKLFFEVCGCFRMEQQKTQIAPTKQPKENSVIDKHNKKTQ